jgi:glutamate formiminotransferase/formiminotetrahydrofolate cyclodeaminase
MKRIVECVPNFSEGRRSDVVDEIVAAIRSVPGVVILDREMDPDHNRSVITFVAEPDAAVEAAVRGTRRAAELIDLTRHQGEHPRIGATDVIPFVPIRNVTMEECVELARRTGRRIADEVGIPVYLYERAATRPDRIELASIRRGEFEGLREAIATDADRYPDFGEPRIHPTAGATVVGARQPLIAYNVNLNTTNLDVAKKIARAVRGRDGGLRYVKALGFELKDRGLVQVSMNLTDYQATPLFRAFEMVKREAERYGVTVHSSEIVGLVPQAALDQCAEWYLQLENFSSDQVLENRLAATLGESVASVAEPTPAPLSESIGSFPDRVAAGTPTPGGGSVAALGAVLAAALGQMVCHLTRGKKKFADRHARVSELHDRLARLRQSLTEAIQKDAESFDQVLAAYRLPSQTEGEQAARAKAIEQALRAAATIPLQTATDACTVLDLLAELAELGNPNALADLATGAQMALAAVTGAAYNVLVNLNAISDRDLVRDYRQRVEELMHRSHSLAARVDAAFRSRTQPE